MSRHEPEEHKESPSPRPRMTERVDEEREPRERTPEERGADDEPWICRGID